MAKRNDKAAGQAAYRKLKQDLRQGTVGSLYLFHGEEAYLRDHYLDQMKAKLIPPGMESFNYHRLAGKTLTAQRLAETVDALPMMSPRGPGLRPLQGPGGGAESHHPTLGGPAGILLPGLCL